MITKAEVDALLKDDRVKSVSLCKYLRKEVESRYFIDIVLVNGERRQDEIKAQVYEELDVLEATDRDTTIGCKTLK